MMMNLHLTGATGFVGKNLLSYLKNDEFLCKAITRTQLLNADQLDLNGCNAIIHLAGKAHDLKKTADEAEYFSVNYELTKKLYDTFLSSDAKIFIFISSVKAAADSIDHVLTEAHIPNPQTAYGKSKLLAEEYIQAQTLPAGKTYYILRPCMIHGPGNKGNLNLLYQFVQKGIPYPLAAFKNERSFLSVSNLCFVIKKLLRHHIESGIYNVADNQALSTSSVVEILAKASGKKPKFLHIPTKAIKLIAHFGNYLKLPLNTERLNKLTENYVVSNIKLINAINDKLPLSAIEGLKLTASSFNKH